MRSKSLLLGSVSAVAVSAAYAPALAQDLTIPDGYSLSVEGGFLMGPNTVAEDKLGSFPSGGVVDIQDNVGYRAAISLGKRIDPLWDLRVGASLNHQLESISTFSFFSAGSGSGSGSSFSGEMRNDFDFENLDFEVGYTPVLDENFQVRLFAGIRGLHYKDTFGFTETEDKVGSLYQFNADFQSEFIGAGPRIGASASTRFGDSNFGMSGMVSGAVIHGLERRSAQASVSAFSGGSGGTFVVLSESDEEWKTVLDVAASLGLDYYVAEQTKLTLGYRAEQLFNVGGGVSGGDSSDRLVHGPFMKFESEF